MEQAMLETKNLRRDLMQYFIKLVFMEERLEVD